MLKIRLRRMGSTHRPFFRVVVSDSRRTPTASAVEEIGYYDPRKSPSVVKIETDRIEYWTSQGAQLSDAVRKLVKQQATGVVGTFSSAATEAVKTEPEAAKAEPKAEAVKAEATTEEAAEAKPAEAEKAEPEAAAEAKPAEAEKAEPEAATEETAEAEKAEAETTEATSA